MAPDPNSPIRHFRADSPFIKSESAWVAQTYRRLQNYTKLRRAFHRKSCANRPKEILANRNRQFFLRKTDKFCANRPHTAPGGVVCRGTAGGFFEHLLWVAETWQGEFFICYFIRNRFHRPVRFQQVSSPCFFHSQHVLKESACSAAAHSSVRRRVWSVCAKFVYFAKKIACFDLPKFPLACLRKICGGMPSSTSYSSVADDSFAQPRPIHSW